MKNRVHISRVKELLDDGTLSIQQIALIFNISESGVYQRFWRMKKGLLKGKCTELLKPAEIERMKQFLMDFEEYISNYIAKLEKEQ